MLWYIKTFCGIASQRRTGRGRRGVEYGTALGGIQRNDTLRTAAEKSELSHGRVDISDQCGGYEVAVRNWDRG
jgi:hypothetical protein